MDKVEEILSAPIIDHKGRQWIMSPESREKLAHQINALFPQVPQGDEVEKVAIALFNPDLVELHPEMRWGNLSKEVKDSYLNTARRVLKAITPQGDDGGLIEEQYLTEFIFQYLDRSQETYNNGSLSNQDRAKHIMELVRLIKQDEKCSYCDGVGVVPTGQSNEIICPKCNGSRRQPKFDEEEIRTEATKYYAEKMAEAIERLRIKKDAEHQQKIAEIFEEMEKHERIGLEFNALPNHIHFTMPKDIWSALKSSFLKEGWGGQ